MSKNQNLENLMNDLENQPENIPQFLKALLDAEVFCLAKKDENNQIQFRLLETEDGDKAIPFFLSLQTIHNDLGTEVEFLELTTRELFETTKGSILVLNPTSDISKEFSPKEIQFLLEVGIS